MAGALSQEDIETEIGRLDRKATELKAELYENREAHEILMALREAILRRYPAPAAATRTPAEEIEGPGGFTDAGLLPTRSDRG